MNEIIKKVEETEKAAQKLVESARDEAATLKKESEQEVAARLSTARGEAKQIIQTSLSKAREEARTYREKTLSEARDTAERRAKIYDKDSQAILDKLLLRVLPLKGDANRQ